jgi:hypothetical protein
MGKFSLNFDSVDLYSLVADISNMIRIQVQLRPSVTFELNVQPNFDLNIDEEQKIMSEGGGSYSGGRLRRSPKQ